MSKKSKAVLITGASRGIGRAIALLLAELGWDVGINYLENQTAAGEVLDAVEQHDQRGVLCQGDMGSTEGRANALSTFRKAFQRIDALVNNAGVAPKRRDDILDIDEESYERVLAANLKGPFFLTQAISSWMIEIRSAHPDRPLHIVNISSASEYAVTVARSQYCIAKAGMGMMTKLYATRLAEHNILVNEIRPGIVATDMTAGVKEKYDERIRGGLMPLRRWGQGEDVAQAVAALVGGAFPFTTGAALDVDGGMHIPRL